jgi:hypothetical protein
MRSLEFRKPQGAWSKQSQKMTKTSTHHWVVGLGSNSHGFWNYSFSSLFSSAIA